MPKYNPLMLQVLADLGAEKFLELIGCVMLKIIESRRDVLPKDYVEAWGAECAERIGASRPAPSKLPNDLRRLGLVEAGDPAGGWPSNISARLDQTLLPLLRFAASRLSSFETGALVVAIAIIKAKTGCTRMLRELFMSGKLSEDTRRKLYSIDVGEKRVQEYLLHAKELVEYVKRTLGHLSLPLLVVPLELWKWNPSSSFAEPRVRRLW